MTTDSAERDPVEALAAEFIDRRRQGESPSIEEYCARHPDLAAEIRDLFPTIAAMEQLKLDRTPARPVPPARDLRPLERLGDFRIIREIGRGGMGIVFEAEQESLGRRVAVKVLPSQALPTAKQLSRFEREARTAARLHHTNIVPVFGVGEQDGQHYYVMQYIRGVGLDAVIEALGQGPSAGAAEAHADKAPADSSSSFTPRRAAQALRSGTFPQLGKEPSGEAHNGFTTHVYPSLPEPSPRATMTEAHPAKPPTQEQNDEPETPDLTVDERPTHVPRAYWKAVARLGRQVANALDYAHSQHILHRDIKPANLLLDAGGNVWVADFGLAKALEQDKVSNTGDVVGTLQYMAPEQFQGKYDHRSDICSLGLTLYEMVTFRPAFRDSNRFQLMRRITQEEAPRPRSLNPAIPRDLETIVLKAIARDPGRRYQSARDLENDLQRYLEDRPIQARRAGPAERLVRWCRRNPAVASLTALAFVLLILVAVVASVGYVQISEALEGEKNELQRAEKALDGETKERLRAEKALDGEAKERLRAEATSGLALEVLEQIFEQLAPDRIVAASQLTFDSGGGEQIEFSLQPTPSPETAVVLEKLLVFYDRLAEQGINDSKIRRQAAKATRRVGDIQLYLGQPDQAVEAYQRSATLYRELAKQAPTDPTLTADLAGVYNAIGQALRKNLQADKAKEAHQSAIQVLTAASKDSPASPKISYELARTHFHLSRAVFETLSFPAFKKFGGGGKDKQPGGKGPGGPPKDKTFSSKNPGGPHWAAARAESDKHLGKAVQLLKDLVNEQPVVPAYRHLLALCHREKSTRFAGPFGKSDGEDRKAALTLLRDLTEQYPSVPEYRYDLCLALSQQEMGGPPLPFFAGSKNLDKDYQEALALAKGLVTEHPNVPDYQITKSHIHMKLAQLHQHNKQFDKAEEEWRQSLKIHNALIQRYPKVTFHLLSRAKVQESLAVALFEQKKLKESRTLLDSSIDQLSKLIAQDDSMKFLNWPLADTYQKLADTLTALQEPTLAAQARQTAKELRANSFKGPNGPPKKPG